MKVTIVPEDRVVLIDRVGAVFDFSIDSNIHAIQWQDNHGHIEYKDGRPNEKITSIAPYQHIIDAYYVEKDKQAQEIAARRVENEAKIAKAKPYMDAIEALKIKHKNKKLSNLSKEDVEEYTKLRMAQHLELEL